MKKRGLFHGKKAQSIIHAKLVLIFELVVPLLILLILLAWVNDLATNQSFDKNYVARDTALLTSVLYSSPENIFYNHTTEQYIFDFSKNQVKVLFKDDNFPIYYHYSKNNIIFKNQGEIKTNNSLLFLKSDNEFEVNTALKINIDKIPCPLIITNKPSSLGIDPLKIDRVDKDITLKIAETIKTNLITYIPDTRLTRDEELERDVKDLENVESIIGIRAKSDNFNKNYLKAYYSLESSRNKESRKLACLTVNKLLDSFEFDGAAVIGINPEDFNESHQEKILDNNKVAIILEIGNLNTKKGIKILEDYSKVSKLIKEGIKEYGNE